MRACGGAVSLLVLLAHFWPEHSNLISNKNQIILWYLLLCTSSDILILSCVIAYSIYYECLCAFMKNFSNNIKRKDWNSPFSKSFSNDSLENYSFNFTSLYKINRFEIRNTKAKEIFVGLCSGLWIKQNILILSSDIVERFQRFLKRRHWFCILICD